MTSNPAGVGGTLAAPTGRRGGGTSGPDVPDRPILGGGIADDEIEGLKDLARALAYDGFSTVKIREIAIRTIPKVDLVKILVAAAQVGNAPERLTGKVTDPEKARDVVRLISTYRVKSAGAVGATDLTLARLASAFAPLYFSVRRQVSKHLQNQDLGTGLSVEWQSPSLSMYSDSDPARMAWLLAFGRQIKPKSEDVNMTDARTRSFSALAVSNRTRDRYLDSANLGLGIKELLDMAYKPGAGA
jgi:hypothetical protein